MLQVVKCEPAEKSAVLETQSAAVSLRAEWQAPKEASHGEMRQLISTIQSLGVRVVLEG